MSNQRQAPDRFERRRTRTHQSILSAATSLIQARGLQGFSLDDVARQADVSRATVYNHYADRGALLREVVEPVFRLAQERVDLLLAAPERITLEAICDLCVDLWTGHQDRFGLVGPAGAEALGDEVRGLHERFAARFVALFTALERRIRFRLDDAPTTARLVYRCCIPILESLGGAEGYRETFAAMIRALVVSPAAP